MDSIKKQIGSEYGNNKQLPEKGKKACLSDATVTETAHRRADSVGPQIEISKLGKSTSMALSVTRHALNPQSRQFKWLLSGIDTLDLGLYVSWGIGWKRRLLDLDKKKQRARAKGGLLIKTPSGRDCVFLPGGKGQNYRYHIQFEAYNVFIGKAAKPGSSPNVYLSISAKTLWLNGIETALSWIAEDLKAIGGGSILSVKVSRVDLCADFLIPGGMSYGFLLSHKVTRNDKGKLFLGRDELETCYIADAKSPIQLRIYSKGAEVMQGGAKLVVPESVGP